MEGTTLPWLNALAGTIASTAVLLLFVVNGLFALGVFLGRDRSFVNRWTKPLVVTDAALLLAAVGTPVVALALKLGVKGVMFLATIPPKLMPVK
jgi:hypothetical protein